MLDEIHDADEPKFMHAGEMLLPCNALDEVERSWIVSQYFASLKSFSTTLGFLTSVQTDTVRFIEAKLVTLTQGIEALSRLIDKEHSYYVDANDYDDVYKAMVESLPQNTDARLRDSLKIKLKYANEISLRRRIELLAKRIPTSLRYLVGGPNSEFAARAAKVRNAITHNDWTDTSEPNKTEYVLLNYRLELVIVCAVLRTIGVSPNLVVDRLPRSPRFKELNARSKVSSTGSASDTA